MPSAIDAATADADAGGDGPSSKKRRTAAASATVDDDAAMMTSAEEAERRRPRADWTFVDVLLECGCRVVAPTSADPSRPDDDGPNREEGDGDEMIGFELDDDADPTSLTASLRGLLTEMDRGGIDEGNERVAETMLSWLTASGGGDEDGGSGGGGEEADGLGALGRAMLPLHRHRRGRKKGGGGGGGDDDENEDPQSPMSAHESSLLKILLRVDRLQPSLLTLLLQKLVELAMMTSGEDTDDGVAPSTPPAAKRILGHVRWLDHVASPSDLTREALECLTTLSQVHRPLALDLIALLPDLVSHSPPSHGCGGGGGDGDDAPSTSSSDDDVVSTLRDLYQTDPSWMIPVLDAVSSLPLSEEQTRQIGMDGLSALRSCDRSDLPSVAQFLVHHVAGADMCSALIRSLRELRLGDEGGGGAIAAAAAGGGGGAAVAGGGVVAGRGGGASSSTDDAEAVTLEVLSRGFRYRADLTDALLSAVGSTLLPGSGGGGDRGGREGGESPQPAPAPFGPSDVWLLLCCASAPHNRARVRSMFRKLACGLDEGTVRRVATEAVTGNGVALAFVTGAGAGGGNDGSGMDVCDSLLRAPERPARSLGQHMYQLLFHEFPSPISRQELVAALIAHTSSPSTAEVDAAMSVLHGLVTSNPGQVRPYGAFVLSLLDSIRGMSEGQCRLLFLILFALNDDGVDGEDDYGDDDDFDGRGGGGGDHCADDVHIVIRKFLSLHSPSMKRIGTIGAICFAISQSRRYRGPSTETMNDVDDDENTCLNEYPSAAGSSSKFDRHMKDIANMLEMAHSNCKNSSTSLSNVATANYNLCSTSDTSFASGGMYRGGEGSSSSLAFFFDELGRAIRGRRLAPPVRDWVLDRFSGDLEDMYMGEFIDPAEEGGADLQRNGATGSGMIDVVVDAKDKSMMMGSAPTMIRSACNDQYLLPVPLPRGEMRFNIDGDDALIYVKMLSLVASSNPVEQYTLPEQLCPLLRLLASCHDRRYGGFGVSEIDAVLGCPLLLPCEDSLAMDEYPHLPPACQQVAATCIFYATCWCRELVNSFVHSAAFPDETSVDEVEEQGAQKKTDIDDRQPELSACAAQEEMRTKVVDRLNSLCSLQQELASISRKSYHFAPPGMALLPLPKEMKNTALDSDRNNDGDENFDPQSFGAPNVTGEMTKDERKALTAKKKAAAKQAAARQKSKAKLLKVRKKHEEELAGQAISALRPLSSLVCLALGFPELSVMGSTSLGGQGGSQMVLSLGASQLKSLRIGGPVTSLLLKQLHEVLSGVFSERKSLDGPFGQHGSRPTGHANDAEDNPYDHLLGGHSDDKVSPSLDRSLPQTKDRGLSCIDTYLAGGVFVAIHEHLASLAEICGGEASSDDEGCNRRFDLASNDDEMQDRNTCLLLLIRCVSVLMGSKELTSSPRGRSCLFAVLLQLADGDRDANTNCSVRSRSQGHEKNIALSSFLKPLSDLFDLLEEILMGGETTDLEFAMEGVNGLEATLRCALRLEKTMGSPPPTTTVQVEHRNPQNSTVTLRKKLSDLCHRLLQRKWAQGTKFNKGNVGKLVSLYIEHSHVSVAAAEGDPLKAGRLGTLTNIAKYVLPELANTDRCKGPVETYPTLTSQSFGNYFSVLLEYLPLELDVQIGNACVPGNTIPLEKSLQIISLLTQLLGDTFDLIKDNPPLVKRPFLLQQLRGGTRFMEKFVANAVPFLQTNFQEQEAMVVDIIKQVQNCTRQLVNVISHGKREKDPNLAKETPRAKKILEIFIHKIKSLMRKNRCLTALWGGNLKAKMIDGSVLEDENADDSDGGHGQDENEETETEEEGDGDESDDDSSDEDES